jgi:hypothetical protein
VSQRTALRGFGIPVESKRNSEKMMLNMASANCPTPFNSTGSTRTEVLVVQHSIERRMPVSEEFYCLELPMVTCDFRPIGNQKWNTRPAERRNSFWV